MIKSITFHENRWFKLCKTIPLNKIIMVQFAHFNTYIYIPWGILRPKLFVLDNEKDSKAIEMLVKEFLELE